MKSGGSHVAGGVAVLLFKVDDPGRLGSDRADETEKAKEGSSGLHCC